VRPAFLIAIAVVVVGVVVGIALLASLGRSIDQTYGPSEPSALSPSKVPPQPERRSFFEPPVTLAEYSALTEGMSYEQAVRIIGESGTEVSRSEIAGFSTVMYSWQNPGGANMNAMFQNGSLVTKAQFGLK
jgi:hypothetical protein